ncbi:MAG: hypothetical protein IT383_01950 [Deltaproteobacteria bacterium]|nr:hypothetical protein [Deltaproteobacteria bacterium]
MNLLLLLFDPRVLLGALLVCGAVVPGPCTFDPQRGYDCALGDPCERNFACAADGYCKSADIACADGEERCEYPGLDRVGICVRVEELERSKTHCGGCFARCLGDGTCSDGRCTGAPAAGRCVLARGNFDCSAGSACADDGDGDDVGDCTGAPGTASVLAPCTSGAECSDGLCVNEVCTRTCDFGCPLGTVCDDEGAPGGVCVLSDEELCR